MATITKYKLSNGTTTHDFRTPDDVYQFQQRYPEWAGIAAVMYEEQVQPEPVNVPQEITLWQLKSVLRLQNLEAGILSAINALPEPNKTVALTAFEYAKTILRTSPTIAFIQQALNLTSEQVDNLFIQAEQIEA